MNCFQNSTFAHCRVQICISGLVQTHNDGMAHRRVTGVTSFWHLPSISQVISYGSQELLEIRAKRG